MRTKKALANTIAGGAGTLLVGVLHFVARIVFLRFLSDEYLGISGLFTNILSILSLAELGIGTAICFRLYKPLADKDEETIRSIMLFFKKTYFLIGWVIVALGAILLPFLPYLMNGTTDLVNINLIYGLYILQSASSYWFWAYKGILLQADQKLYVTKIYFVLANTIIIIVQLVTLAIFKDFLVYSVIGMMTSVLMNILVSRSVDRTYPFMKVAKAKPLEKEQKKEILKDVFGMSLFKINTTIVNSTDNIVISAFINVKTVALYGNYQVIISGISQVIMQVFSGVTASVGHLATEKDDEKNEFVFRCLQLLCYWSYAFVGIALYVLINPMIGLFFGNARVLTETVVLLQMVYFVINGFQRTSFIYRDAFGLFWKGKIRPVATAVLNIIISVVLVQYIGLAGVIIGTIGSWMLTTWWFDPCLIYKQVFHKSPMRYFAGYLLAAAMTAVLGFGTMKLSGLVAIDGLGGFAVKCIICFAIPNLGFLLVYGRTKEFRYLKESLSSIVRKMIGNK